MGSLASQHDAMADTSCAITSLQCTGTDIGAKNQIGSILQGKALVRTPDSNEIMTHTIEYVSQKKHAALQINKHQVITSITEARIFDLIFDRPLPLFQVSDIGMFRQSAELHR
jgi:hypothetical protein